MIDEMWQLGLGANQPDWHASDAPLGGILVDGEVVGSFGKIDYGCASDPSTTLEVLERDDQRARLATLAPRMARLLRSLENSGGDRDGDARCPKCGAYAPHDAHYDNCELGAVLGELAKVDAWRSK